MNFGSFLNTHSNSFNFSTFNISGQKKEITCINRCTLYINNEFANDCSWDRTPFDNYDNKITCDSGTKFYIVRVDRDEGYAALTLKNESSVKEIFYLKLNHAKDFTITWKKSFDQEAF